MTFLQCFTTTFLDMYVLSVFFLGTYLPIAYFFGLTCSIENHKMGRPCASQQNKMAALAFAKIITKQTMDHQDLLARCGRCSLFATLQEMYPHIIREADAGDRDGISEVEFNKILQVKCDSAPTSHAHGRM